ncbi:MAG: CbtB-domain containing protein [Thermoproteota archaeon]|nr:CbtB-domain containing protein [Thermoproteota archaeon]
MLASNQITTKKTSSGVPRIAVGILLGVLVFGVFIVGFDQGEILGFTVPADGSGGDEQGTNWAHEFYHDMRHAAGFPCH